MTQERMIKDAELPICVEHGGPFDDNDGKDMCKTCEDWIVRGEEE